MGGKFVFLVFYLYLCTIKQNVMNMKKSVITAVMVLMSILSAKAQYVSYECNIHTINKEEGQWRSLWRLDDPDGGYVIIHRKKHPDEYVGRMGLLIYKDSHSGRFWCFDTECPKCADNGVKSEIRMKTNIVAGCDRCMAEWQNIHMGSAGQTNQMGEYWLKMYQTTVNGDIVRISNCNPKNP